MSKPNEESYEMEKDIELVIASQTTKTIVSPLVTNSIELTLERKAAPGKLTFKMIFDEKVQEGDQVSLKYRGQNVFLGYVFTRKLGKDKIVLGRRKIESRKEHKPLSCFRRKGVYR